MNLNDVPLAARPAEAAPASTEVLARLLQLSHRARHAADLAELGYILVNETHALLPYRQAALWQAGKATALSGVSTPEANGPYVQWLAHVAAAMAGATGPCTVGPADLPAADAAEWDQWLPAHAAWLPLAADAKAGLAGGGLLLARDDAFGEGELALAGEWLDHWRHAAVAQRAASASPWRRLFGTTTVSAPWPRRVLRSRWTWAFAALAGIACIPVHLNVLAPAELVAARPSVIRSPLEGTVDRFFIDPNATVKAGDKLFQLDLAQLNSKLDVARQALATAEAEYRQQAQLAVFDGKSKGQLALLEGRIAERRTEAEFLAGQLGRAQVTAPRDGVALLDDPTEWIGKPVAIGERVMSIADPYDVEVEAWVSPADAIALPDKAAVSLFLNARPLNPIGGALRYVAYESVARPDGTFAYRLRATLPAGQSDARVGLKGTAKISGGWVPAGYLVARRPIAWLRQTLGL